MILVTGATGLVGRPLIDHLVSQGAQVRAVTRNPATANLPAEVEVVEGNPADPQTLATALKDVTSLFLNPRPIGPSAEELVRLARECGVQRLVAMSALNVDHPYDRQPSRLRGEFNKEVEAAAVASGLQWVSLRSGYYATNTIGMWAGQLRAGDVVRGCYPEASWAPLDERDLAAAGAHALLHDDLVGKRPVLTGPRSLTQEQMVTLIGEAIGRPLTFEAVSPEVARQGMIRSGMPEPLADGFISMQADSYLQENLVTGEVEKILGRPGTGFGEWAAAHADNFRQG